MISVATLKDYNLKDLAQMARNRGVRGWHTMRKDQLVRALSRLTQTASHPASRPSKSTSSPSKRATSARPAGANGNGRSGSASAADAKGSRISRQIHELAAERDRLKDLSAFTGEGREKPISRDRAVLMVRDPYWLHVYWEIRKQSVQRAQAALAEHWHTARPVLRLLETAHDGTTNTAERLTKSVEIHGGVRNWYVSVSDPPHSYRVELGYLAGNGSFFSICRSNVVTTPQPGAMGPHDTNWSDVAANYERIYAMSGGYASERQTELQELFEERLRRPMGSPASARYGDGAARALNRQRHFKFNVDAEMVISGEAKPGAYVTLSGEPVKVNPDGTFSVRVSFPDRRQVLPLVAASADGVEQRTVVIAVERNTKVLEPVIRDNGDAKE